MSYLGRKNCDSLRRFYDLSLITTVLLIGTVELQAQQPPLANKFPFSFDVSGNPQKMFDAMFGPSTAAEENQLAAVKVTFADERLLGQQVLDAYLANLKLRKLRVFRKGRDVDYLQKLVGTLHPLMNNAKRYQQIAVYVVDSPEVDARAVPGGTLLFSKGLLGFAQSEAALIGIVGHELSHLDREHLLIPVKRAKLLQAQPVGQNGAFDLQKFFTSGTMMMRLLGRPFRPEDESAADRDGAEWAFKAGYDPREMADLFARLQVKNGEQKVPFGDYFRTHPYNADRNTAISALYEKLHHATPPETPLYIGKRNLTKRISKADQKFAE